MIDHISIAVSDLRKSTAFYEQVFQPLGMTKLVEGPARTGFGKAYPEFWLNERADMSAVPANTGCHVCLRCRNREAVVGFYRTALDLGARDGGAPGERQATVTRTFSAFIRDFDGNRIEVVTFPRAAE